MTSPILRTVGVLAGGVLLAAATARAEGAAPLAAPAPVSPDQVMKSSAAATPAPVASTESIYPPSGVGQGGSVGFGRFMSADAGRPGSLRLNLRGSFFQLNNFPTVGTDRLLAGEISGGVTVYPGVEIFGAYLNTSNSNTKTTPSVVQAQGDGVVGVKGGAAVGPVQLAALVQADLRNGLGADHITVGASALELRALATWGTKAGPGLVQLDFNAGGILGQNKDALDVRLNGDNSALLFGTGFSAYNQVVTGLLVRYAIAPVSPFLGVDFDIPVGIAATTLKAAKTDAWDVSAKRITLGARIPTWHFGAFDVALQGGLGKGVTGFARTEPWLLTAGYSFAFDPGLYRPAPPPPPAPPAPVKEVLASVRGSIVDSATGAPIVGAVVTPTGGLPVATAADGTFVTRDLKPGQVELKFEREGYEAAVADVTATVKSAPIAVKLVALPPPAPIEAPPAPVAAALPTGYIAGMIVGPEGGVAGAVKISGTTRQELRTNADGSFSAKLDAGKYDVLVLPDGFFARTATVVVETDKAVPVILKTTPKAPTPVVSLEGDAFKFTQPWVLDEKRVEPTDAQLNVLAEVADALVRSPEKMLSVDVHSDLPKNAKGDRIDWTEERAQAIRTALIDQGAPADRVEAHGLGTTQPLVPATSKAANTNRRVEIKLVPRPERKVVPIQHVAPKTEEAPAPTTVVEPPGAQVDDPTMLDLPPIN